MQKLNIGNMTTNAMQTLSIAATTASGMHRANEDRKLVNKLSGREYLSPEDVETIGKANAARQVQNARMYEGGAGGYTEEQEDLIASAGADAKYETAKAYWENKNAVEDAMEGAPTAQSENIKEKVTNDIVFSSNFYKQYNTKPGDVILKKRKVKEVEENDNADV